ncbi:acetyl-CoA C-acyltransferase [Aquabacterium soli]|uniref:Acetyl-CoA C-acyltransferase n=1 Tax=Aquabacterium soli TaxID=2493092 RepID=A0A426VCR7_9BURK|nr:acetyl-CoA C-acyltransferase [Aquabacterium soli]RRS04669.1 acetyl-CoA C-acyltransferase [Aquabacterium soli]
MSAAHDPVVIIGARRTPIGSFQGALSSLSSPALGGVAIAAAIAQAGVPPELIDEVLMGNCLMAGVGQAPARQALRAAGLPVSVPATTLSKMCGSAMKTVMLAHDQLLAGTARVLVAGGMESMSQAPYLLPSARAGQRLGHGQMIDHMFFDGLQDAYDGQLMGAHADRVAERLGFDRASQDAYALRSVQRAQDAVARGLFDTEISPVTVPGTRDAPARTVEQDETPGQCQPDKITRLKAAFRSSDEGGTVTAASSASISDGAAALVLCRESTASAKGWRPLARLVAHSTHAAEPGDFASAPVGAITQLLTRVGWEARQVDLYEINEAFAMVPMIAIRELGLDEGQVNVRGGACAMGHPIGATGARIIVTLLHTLAQTGGIRGVASLCIGGGEATAIALERLG